MTSQQLKSDVKQAGRDVDHLINTVQQEGSAAVSSLRESLTPLLQSLRDSVQALRTEVRDRATTAAQKTNEYAHENPWRIVGIAAATGVVIGLLLTRRSN